MKNQHLQKLDFDSSRSLVGAVIPTLLTVSFLPAQIAGGITFAKSAVAESPTNQSSQLFSNDSPTYLAQSNPLYGCWRLTHSYFGIVYESALQMNGDEGVMITGYFDPNIGRTAFVQQTMKMVNSARGIVILGYDPVYPGTNRRHPTYNPDNFVFQVKPSGDYIFRTCDDAGQCSPVEVNQCPKS